MVKVHDIKKFQKDFKENFLGGLVKDSCPKVFMSDLDKGSFEVASFDRVIKKLDNFNEFSELRHSFYSKNIIENISEYVYVCDIDSSSRINILGFGNVLFNVKSDSKISLECVGDSYLALNVFLIIEEGISVNLLNFLENLNSVLNVFIYVKDGSELIVGQANLASKICQFDVYLESGVKYNLRSFYHVDSNISYMKNSSFNIGRNSDSDMLISGFSSNGGKILVDGLVNIAHTASKSKGTQKIDGIILDNESSITSDPILEINNNEVVCSHGSSISRVTDEKLFYLSSRGLDKNMIISLLKEGLLFQVFDFSDFDKDIFLD